MTAVKRFFSPGAVRALTVVTALALLVALGFALAQGLGVFAQEQANPYYQAVRGQADKAHHTPNGFQNRYGGNEQKSLLDVLQWQITRKKAPLPETALPASVPQLDAPVPNVTWIGHSTVLGQVAAQQVLDNGTLEPKTLRFITDPHFSERASPFSWAGPKRLYPAALTPEQLPDIDVVLLSHNHYDHLDVASVQAIAAQEGERGNTPLFLVPLGLKAWFQEQGIDNVVELDWWQSHRVAGVEFMLTPAQHWSSRTPFDRRNSLWGGFAVYAPSVGRSPAQHWIYTGDTGYSPDFRDIAQRMRAIDRPDFNLAMIPIGCYEPRDFMRDQHNNPHEAVQILKDLGARRAIGVHWGTFQDLCDEPLDQAPQDLVKALAQNGLPPEVFRPLARGQTLVVE